MARTVRNPKLDTRSARAKLPMRDSPYWVSLAPGCALGYRKGPKGGVWLAKIVRDETRQQKTLGPADDALDPDGVLAVSYAQAQTKARDWFSNVVRPEKTTGPYSVRDAVTDYLDWFRAAGRKSIKETEASVNAFILPQFGDDDVLSLTPTRLRKWHTELAAAAPRLRTKRGERQSVRDTAGDSEAPRRRQATANRILTVLKAALNHAWREGKVASDNAWRRVAPFREADAARVRYLDRDECRRLVNASPEPLRKLVRGALLTGARYSELARMRVADFHRDSGTVLVRTSKAGKVRHIELTLEGLEFFNETTAGRVGRELLFHRDPPLSEEGGSREKGEEKREAVSGEPQRKDVKSVAWGKSHQQRPLAEACRGAQISPAASFHTLRHTYASLMVMDGVPLMVVARNLGHADTRMVEKHYGHLATSYVREAIRAAKPLGISDAAKVVPLVGAR
jgi:integrase